jgi:penicillin G amidase
VVLLIIVAGLVYIPPRLNSYQVDGAIALPGLSKPVTVTRDEKGMAYIKAENLDDAITAQGFVTAQDRLFQMQLNRMMAQGRISELAGDRAIGLDTRMRTIGMHRVAKAHAKILDKETRDFFQKYADGVNAFIKIRLEELPLEFKLSGLTPEPWSIVDSLSVLYYMGWTTSGNIQIEIIAQMLVEKLGPEKARELFPINVNPDEKIEKAQASQLISPSPYPLPPGERDLTTALLRGNRDVTSPSLDGRGKGEGDKGLKLAEQILATNAHVGMGGFADKTDLAQDDAIQGYLDTSSSLVGSNNWAVAPRLSQNGKPVVANDPHLDSRFLPGVWHTCGIITPEYRHVGAMIAGIPGLVVGRTSHIAVGVTNAYGDCQDLYVETIDPKDPNKYMEGETSLPFRVEEETLKIKDKQAPNGYREEKIKIRFTKRGPIISSAFETLKTNKPLSLRWAAAETMAPSIGLLKLSAAKSAEEAADAIKDINMIVLNVVFADTKGNIGWRVSGKLPIRSQRDGTAPYVVKDGKDNWIGWIPADEMPHSNNPARGWVGTCNHMTVPSDYKYYYSSQASPSYRQRRLIELLDAPGPKSDDDHWRFQRDDLNVMAGKIAPIMASALKAKKDTEELGNILASWDFRDDLAKAAPTIFQETYRNFARLVYEDKLGPQLTSAVLNSPYFWQERLQRMVLAGSSSFEKPAGPNQKDVGELFRKAALQAKQRLSVTLGNDPQQWTWGRAHQVEWLNPIRREGFGKSLLGAEILPMGGSGETLYRASYQFDKPFDIVEFASLRMVADLGDPDKILAVLPGGVVGRTFHRHQKDQIEPFMKGDKVYWWFSDKAINEHGKHRQTLNPR